MKQVICPRGHKKMVLKKLQRETRFRGVTITYEAEAYVCPECGLEAGTIESAGAVQRAIADGYRKARRLLTGEEIRALRHAREISDKALAARLKIAAALVNGWESGLVQSEEMDRKLRACLL